MAKPPFPSSSLVLFTILFLIAITQAHAFINETMPKSPPHKQQKLTHLHFYIHDTVTSKDPSAVVVAEADTTNSSDTRFGEVSVVDDPLTEGPDPGSRRLGGAQGVYIFSSKSELSLTIVFNLYFTVGKFNGSTISLVGRDPILSNAREMPIVGGSGVFRLARGYVEFRTHKFNLQTGNAILDVNVYALRY